MVFVTYIGAPFLKNNIRLGTGNYLQSLVTAGSGSELKKQLDLDPHKMIADPQP